MGFHIGDDVSWKGYKREHKNHEFIHFNKTIENIADEIIVGCNHHNEVPISIASFLYISDNLIAEIEKRGFSINNKGEANGFSVICNK